MTAACGLALALAVATLDARAQSPEAPPAAAGEPKPVAVIVISSYEKLLQNVDFIGGLVGMPGASQIVEGQIGQMTGGQGLAGLDKTKPIGVMIDMSMIMPTFAAYLPVTDQAALLGALQPLGITGQDMGDGVTQINAMGQDAYAKTTNGYMLVDTSPDALKTMPADPSAMLGALTSAYDIAIQVNVQNLPEPMRQQGIQAMAAAQSSMTKLDGESDAEFEARKATMQQQIDASTQMMREMDAMTIGLAIAAEQKKVHLDVALTAIPGSQMATEFSESASATTNFAGFNQPDAAATLSFAGKIPASTAAQIEASVAEMRSSISRDIEDEDSEKQQPLRDALDEVIAAVLETVKGGTMDGGAMVTMAPNSSIIVVGGLIADPAKIENALKKLADAYGGADSKLPTITWAAETHGDVTFHTMQVPATNPQQKAMFGETMNIVVGLGARSAYLSFGAGAADALKSVIDASAAAPGTPVKPYELTVAVGKILNTLKAVAPEAERPMLETAAGVLASSGGLDHIHAVGQPIENGMQFRFEVEQGVLQAAAVAAMSGRGAAPGPPGAGVPQ